MNLNYKMPRDDFQDIFAEWLEDNGFDSYGYYDNQDHKSTTDRGGFENDVFLINPYYWGDDEEIADEPNFIYKPKNIVIEWYKYPFRSSYSNYNFRKVEDLENMLIECSKSMGIDWNRKANGFEIKCNKCGNTDIELKADSDYEYDGEDEHLVIIGHYLYCSKCGNSEDII